MFVSTNQQKLHYCEQIAGKGVSLKCKANAFPEC